MYQQSLPLFMAAVTATAAVLLKKKNARLRRRMMQTRRRYWVHPVIANREERGQFRLIYNDLRAHNDKFFNYTRMSVSSFDELLRLTYSYLEHQNTNFRMSVDPAERLLVTLRYLATGNSFSSLQFEYKLGKSTVSLIVHETCAAIWQVLKELVMKKPTREDWAKIAEVFWQWCYFPNCVGAVDGKHIRIISPFRSGSKYFNYKNYFSFVLMAVADANYSFTYVDIGSYGSSSDSSVISHSSFGKMLRENTLDLPDSQPLPGTTQPLEPYVFVGDEAFPISERLHMPKEDLPLKRGYLITDSQGQDA